MNTCTCVYSYSQQTRDVDTMGYLMLGRSRKRRARSKSASTQHLIFTGLYLSAVQILPFKLQSNSPLIEVSGWG